MISVQWRIVLSLTTAFGLVLLFQSDVPASRFLPLQDVVVKTASLRGDIKSNNKFQATADADTVDSMLEDNVRIPAIFTQNNTSDPTTKDQAKPFQGEGEPMSLPTAIKNRHDSEDQEKPFQGVGVKMSLSTTRNSVPNKEEVSLPSQGDDETPNVTDQVDSTYENFMKDCSSSCLAQVQQHKERWGGDLLNILDVKRLALEAREKMIARLKVDYGEENFAKIFEVQGESRGRKAFLSANTKDGVSIERFKRKLKMKILKMQNAIQAERESLKESSRRILADNRLSSLPDHYETMVWATGGHSAAAGHGNLFNESYTAFMNRAVTDVFGAVGIDFEGRNHAMGGTASGPEIALCSEQVFGTDADVISWDFSMTDGSWFFRQAMYEQRIGLNPNRPAIIALNVGGREYMYSARIRIHQRVEERGLTAIYLDPDEFDAMEDMFPDTFGLSTEKIDAMPRMVQHFKCQGQVENGEPTCKEHKYNLEICPKRPGMASWHPGWRRMALWGNILALFLSDMLLDSITELGSTSNRTNLLTQLLKEEDVDYQNFLKSASPDPVEYDMSHDRVPLDKDLVNKANVSVFFRNPSICRTARLPSQSRYLGILTESKQIGVHNYEKGISMAEAKNITSNITTMPLVYDEKDRMSCEAELNRDHMDYFLVSNRMRLPSLTIPNEAERQAYGRESEKLNGIIVLCSVPCPWDRCPEGEWQLDAIRNGTVNFHVNDKPVTNVTDFAGCGILRGNDGHRWQPNKADQYVLRANVSGNHSIFSFLRISSLIVL